MIGKKRNRDFPDEEDLYRNINIPFLDTDPFDYILAQINSQYDKCIQYYLLFNDYGEKVLASCLWGHLPLYDGIIAKSVKRVEIDPIASWTNFGKDKRIFDMFSNLQCLLNVDKDEYKKLSFFEKGKYGFIFEGKKDYFLLIDTKSLDKFNSIDNDKDNDYCQLWVIKIDSLTLLDLLKLVPKDKSIARLNSTIDELKKSVQERDISFQKERKEYNDRINKMIKEYDKNLKNLEEEIEKLKKEKEEIIENYRQEQQNRKKRVKKFKELDETKISLSYESNIVPYYGNENVNDNKVEDLDIRDNVLCIICSKRYKNILFEKCGHCCICEECVDMCIIKRNKKTKKPIYFCPMCNSETGKEDDDEESMNNPRKIFFM